MTGGAIVGEDCDCDNEMVLDLLCAVAEGGGSELFERGRLSGSTTGKL